MFIIVDKCPEERRIYRKFSGTVLNSAVPWGKSFVAQSPTHHKEGAAPSYGADPRIHIRKYKYYYYYYYIITITVLYLLLLNYRDDTF